ncbi:MAG: bifunctional riboflavin kinase/FAD synthetase [Polyangia bacterium]
MSDGRITYDARTLPSGRERAIAIGNFDGVHRGHARLIESTIAAARAQGLEACVLTFDPHPARLLAPDRAPPLLMPEARRIELLLALGADRVIVQPFDLSLASLSPRAFAESLLRQAISARIVSVGYDFSFGQKRAGTIATLAELGRELGFQATVTPAVRVRGVVCSSTTIRALIHAGQMEDATALLGRAPEIEGVVIHGAARGRTIGFPTANLEPRTEVLPGSGVYAGWAELPDGALVRAAINVGTNPTFSDERTVHIEAHLLDWKGDLYGEHVRLRFDARLREERRFDGKDALIAQLHDDMAATRALQLPPIPAID